MGFWKRPLLNFGNHSSPLRKAVASLTRLISNSHFPSYRIQALMASRLIAFDEMPGVQPIGIGECLRRILAKMMVRVTGDDVTQECGMDQLCCGLAIGVEVAAHSMNSLFASDGTDDYVVFLNAFNNLNWTRMLAEVRKRWSWGAMFVFNCYQHAATLVLRGDPPSSWLQSLEGVTQSDPLGMLLYGLTPLPLIRLLSDRLRKKIRQCWFADNGAAYAHIDDVLEWHQILSTEGPASGMYTSPTECIIIAHTSAVARLIERFSSTSISIPTGSPLPRECHWRTLHTRGLRALPVIRTRQEHIHPRDLRS